MGEKGEKNGSNPKQEGLRLSVILPKTLAFFSRITASQFDNCFWSVFKVLKWLLLLFYTVLYVDFLIEINCQLLHVIIVGNPISNLFLCPLI